jgi:hypothetical protein
MMRLWSLTAVVAVAASCGGSVSTPSDNGTPAGGNAGNGGLGAGGNAGGGGGFPVGGSAGSGGGISVGGSAGSGGATVIDAGGASGSGGGASGNGGATLDSGGDTSVTDATAGGSGGSVDSAIDRAIVDRAVDSRDVGADGALPVGGRACASTPDCGSGYSCYTLAPGGYCVGIGSSGTPYCTMSASTCPAGTTCSPLPWHQISGLCLRTCAATAECRAGQQCNYVELFPGDPTAPRSAERVCWTACEVGMDQTCNDSPIISSIHGTCQPDGSCKCTGTWAKNPETGRCL